MAEVSRSQKAGRPAQIGGPRREHMVLLGASVVLATAIFTAWLAFGWGGEWATLVADDVGTIITPALAAVACGFAARRATGSRRWSWWLFAASAASWGLGQVAWTYYELIANQAPFPSVADVGYLGAIPLAVAALLVQISSQHRGATFARAVLDGIIISVSILFTSWHFVVGPIVRAGSDSTWVHALTLAYPLSDVVLLAVVVFALTRTVRGARSSAMLVGVGLAAISVADSAFAYFSLTGDYETGVYADAGWFGGYLLVALGAVAFRDRSSHTQQVEGGTRLNVILPYIPVGISVAIAITQIISADTFDAVLWGLVVTLFCFVTARQVATLFEDMALVRTLNEKVDERTVELRDASVALERRERHFRSLVQNASDLILVATRAGTITYASPSAQRLLGRRSQDLEGTTLDTVIHPDDGPRIADLLIAAEARPEEPLSVEWRFSHANGRWRVMQTAVTAQFIEEGIQGLVLNSRDVTERRELEERLRHEALHDSLTGLPNRGLFRDRLEHALSTQARHGQHLALLFVDIDEFKIVNDTAGHTVGDAVLQVIGSRLAEAVRPGDTVARLGGDEFAVLLANLSDPAEAELIAQRILDQVRAPLAVEGQDLRASASVGISLDQGGESSAEELLRHADLAMYIAKGKGKDTYRIFEPDMHTALVERLSLKADLSVALDADEFVLYYQPIVELASGQVTGVEALMRWQHPRLGLVPPTSFIPLAEESGAIVDMGAWAIRQACLQLLEWDRGDVCPGLDMSVNLSARQLAAPGLVSTVATILAETGVTPGRIVLEITETVLMEDIETIVDVLNDLRGLGVRLAIDDFGTGYSSLAYLARLPVQVMKIDRSFVRDLAEEGRTALVRSIRQLGGELGMKLVAEGVETDEVAALLLSLGCEYGQGYWVTPPKPPEALEEFLSERPALGVIDVERLART